MKNPTVGCLIDEEAYRDAIHVAIAPVVAGKRLKPGERVHLNNDEAFSTDVGAIGIVDPFLDNPVKQGERFYLFLFPGTITSLRHEWTHPAFKEEPVKDTTLSKLWIENFAERIHQDYESLMDAAERYEKWDEHTYDNAERYKDVDDWETFWTHYQNITGRIPEWKWAPFTCSC